MARVIDQHVEPPRLCGYLGDRDATNEYRIMVGVSPEELEVMLVRGWRRFGPIYFRPACAACAECVSLRIPVATFRPNRSQRRARRAISGFRVTIGPPRVDEERVALHRTWYAARVRDRGWEASELAAEEYALQFAHPHPAAREITFHDGDRLVAVSLVDVTPNAWSAIYFFYDPAIADRSPGIANVLLGVELARARGISHVYLGYRVSDCASMRYKATFGPHELLTTRPGFDEEPQWSQPRSL